MVTTMRRYLAVAVLTLALTGCDDGGEEAGSTTTEAPTTTATTTVPETTTTVPFETEVRRAVVELLEIRNDVFMNPDASRVAEYISESCVCLERERGVIEGLVANSHRWNGPAVVPLGARLSSEDPNAPTLIIVGEQAGTGLVDSGGTVVEEFPAAPRVVLLVNLTRAGDHWLVNALEPFAELDPDVVEEIVGEGLP